LKFIEAKLRLFLNFNMILISKLILVKFNKII
jgi:hypothetical protein